jgi:hypothetical protein
MTDREEMQQVKQAVAEYIGLYGVTNTRDMQAYCYDVTGINPSLNTVADVLRALGYEPRKKVTRWIFKHNGGAHE